MPLKPNLDLIVPEDAPRPVQAREYIAVFKNGNKTLLYVGDRHTSNISFDMVDFVFSDKSPAMPEIAVVEYENSGRKTSEHGFHDNTLIYAAAVAHKRGLPVVYADLSSDEMIDVLKRQRPGQEITKDDLHKTLTAGGPSKNKTDYNLMSWELNMYGREPFMLENIVAALNKYDTVLAVFGEGHYRNQRLVLEDMLGQPEYITDVPNTRGDFAGLEIKPIKLI